MKKIVYTLIIIFIAFNVNAQLANSKWKTTLELSPSVDVIFNFGTDTLEVTNADDNSSVETMKYSTKDTVLTIQKLYGQSECDTTSIGTYSYKIIGDDLWLLLISDDCYDRSSVIKDIKLDKSE